MLLTGSKVNLRPPTTADVDSIVVHSSNKKISEFTFIPYPNTQLDVEKFIESTIADRKDMTGLHLGVVEQGKKDIIGMVGLNLINHVHRRAEIGYWLSEDYWGRGFGTEAVKLMSDYCFNEVGMELIFAYVQPANVGSWKLLESIGYQRDGLLRKFMYKNNARYDHYFYSLLKN